MPTTVLNLTDLDNLIRRFEEKYGVSSLQMLTDASVRARVSEDVLLEWESYIHNLEALRELGVETRKNYLPVGPQCDKSNAPNDLLDLAA